MSPKRGGAHSAADQLACIAAYFSAAPQRRLQHKQSHGRLPLAWVAASPSARLVAEQHNAWVVLPFDSTALAGCPYAADDYEENSFGAALANATTPLFLLKDALGLGETVAGASGAELQDTPAAAAAEATNGIVAAAAPSSRKKIISWISQATESLADVDHAASPVEPETVRLARTSRAKAPPQKATRPGTGVSGPKVEDPLEAARSCGVHVAGVTTVLVSGVHLYHDHLSRGSHGVAAASSDAAQERRVNPSGTLLFSSTTCCGGSVSSLLAVPPNAAAYDAIPARADAQQRPAADAKGAVKKSKKSRPSIFRDGAELHDDDGGAVDDTAHDPQTAASVYTVQQVNKLHRQVRHGTASAADVYTTVWYRHIFVGSEEATDEVLCGVSRWWLQRPVRVHELPTTAFTAAAAAVTASATATAPSRPSSPLAAPPIYVKFMANIGADLWWPHRLFSVVHHRVAEHPWHATPLLRVLAFLWVLCCVVLESVLHGVPEVPANHPCATPKTDLVATFRALGAVFGSANQLAALDVSHTAVQGVHLLACAVGKVTGAQGSEHASEAADRFVALDVAGCIQLHHRHGELGPLQPLLQTLHVHAAGLARTAWTDAAASPLPLVDLLMTLSLRDVKTCAARSATGLGMALLSHHGRLTWVSGAGCSIDNAALHELGKYAMLTEAVTAIRPSSLTAGAASKMSPSSSSSPSSCSICALDLTSALSLDDLNPAGYLVNLEQLLVPFTYVTDGGVTLLDGHTYPRDLGDYLALCTPEHPTSLSPPVQALLKDLVASLESMTVAVAPTTAAASSASSSSSAKPAHPALGAAHHDIIEALHQRFRSHLYQIDFTYCSFLSCVNSLARQQRLELLNMSQTRVNKDGLFSKVDKTRGAAATTAAAAVAVHNPPLRLFIAEMCEHLSDLSGLAHLTTLECVIVRSGSLGDGGLSPLCTADMTNLQLLDLSYCDRLHHVGCLAKLPALETLILDSTDVLPAEVRQLRSSRSLETLSVRFCTEFAFIGKDKREFEAALGRFPSLKHYVYEDLIGDDELRQNKKTD